jgi:Mrp family chromosome partitioning ATPase
MSREQNIPAALEADVIVLAGAYGSGKSELALNLAAHLAGRRPFETLAWPAGAAMPPPVTPEGVILIDLDIVKPYFRAREVAARFRDFGVRFLDAAEGFAQADVPAISPAILAALRLGRERLIVDLAGDQAGARLLRGLRQSAPGRSVAFLLVANPYRPFSGDASAIAATGAALAAAAELKLAGIVANPHLLAETTEDRVVWGYREVARAAQELGVPVVWAAARAELCPSLQKRLPVPVFAVRRFLHPPWEWPS